MKIQFLQMGQAGCGPKEECGFAQGDTSASSRDPDTDLSAGDSAPDYGSLNKKWPPQAHRERHFWELGLVGESMSRAGG